MGMEHWWNDTDREETPARVTVSTANLSRIDPALEQPLR